MKITIGTSDRIAIERNVSRPLAPPDTRPFEARHRDLIDRLAKHKRKRFVVIDGGKTESPQ